jgi:hypothetical protein
VIVSRRATSGAAIAAVIDRLERLARGRLPAVANGVVLLAMAAAAAAALADIDPTRSTSGLGAWVLAAVFGWAAAAKVLRREAWVGALPAYGLGPLERPAAVAVPVLEAAVAALVVAGLAPTAGIVALVLTAAFSVAIVRARARVGDRLPCGCFGRTGRREVRLVLFRNAALAGLAAMVWVSPTGAPTFRAPTASEVVPAVLVGAGAFLAGAMLRELGRMPERPVAR